MAESIFHGCTNMGELVSLVRNRYPFRCRRSAMVKSSVNKEAVAVFTKAKQENNVIISSCMPSSMREDIQVSSDLWGYHLPADILETIVVTRLSLSDRIRMCAVCKSWRCILLKAKTSPNYDFPWLLFPQGEGPASSSSSSKRVNQRLFSVYSLSEGRFYNMELPMKAFPRGGYPIGSVRGWLAISPPLVWKPVRGWVPKPDLFLWNPLSGALLQLPSLTTIPSFQEFITNKKCQLHSFTSRVDVNNITSAEEEEKIIVAILCNTNKEVAFCTLGDTRWTVFQAKKTSTSYDDILFCNNVLYTIETSFSEDEIIEPTNPPAAETNTVVLTNNTQVIVKSITYVVYYTPSTEILQGGTVISHGLTCFGFIKSIQGELLVARQQLAVFHQQDGDQDDTGEDEEDYVQYTQTKGIEIFKVDIHSLEIKHKLTNLGDQILFDWRYNSFSVPTRQGFGCDQFQQKGNSIYFISFPFLQNLKYVPKVTRECGVFNLVDGTIKRHLPCFKIPLQTLPFWFTPNLHLLPT